MASREGGRGRGRGRRGGRNGEEQRGGRGRGGPGQGGGRGGRSAGWRPVSEADRISIADRLEQFRAGDLQEMTFEAGLSNHDRALAHDFCKKMGFKSKSYGVGEQRRLTVTRPTPRAGQTQPHTSLSFSGDTQQVVAELFLSYPPTEDELVGKTRVPTLTSPSTAKGRSRDRSMVDRNPGRANEIADRMSLLASRFRKMPALQQIAQQRARLPIASFEDQITKTIDNNQVVLIAGETGCGKTTQVPQYILDHMWRQGKPCKILCTQPRRISATSVAERIAFERGESIGDTVGYQIRLESKGGKHSSIMFCTNGVLIRKLIDSGGQQETGDSTNDGISDEAPGVDATHIVVDEIHERDRNADFLLIVLRDLLPLRPDLRVILMSATLDAELFSNYFNGCPVVQVPGFTFPVRVFYLEDVLAITESGKRENKPAGLVLSKEDADVMDEAISMAWLEDDFELLLQIVTENRVSCLCDYQHPLTGATALMVAAGKGRLDDVSLFLSLGADQSIVSQDGASAIDWAKQRGHEDVVEFLERSKADRTRLEAAEAETLQAAEAEMLQMYQRSTDQEEIDVQLIARLLGRICERPNDEEEQTSQKGAVLIFFPGWEDITRARDHFSASPIFGDSSRYLLLPLHSMVPSSEQRKVFQRPPTNVRKIVLSTNIAETAITIDDVVYVIDCGQLKEKSYDPYTNVSTLQTGWISKASAKQREGRAGRCQPGECYHFFSRMRAASLPDFQVPEIKRTPLEEICLQVKLLQPHGRIAEFISKAIAPPLELSVRNAILLLQDIGMLTTDERLTELGERLGSLPVPPSTSKMLLLGILLNCLDPALTIACAAGYREPFVLPMAPDQKKRAHLAKQQLGESYSGYSDHLCVIAAFDQWEIAKAKGQEGRYCAQNFIASGIMNMLAGMRRRLQNELVHKGFLQDGPHSCSLNSRDPGIIRAVLAAGMYPMVGVLLPPLPTGQKACVLTSRGDKVRIHPHSENFKLGRGESQGKSPLDDLLVVFDEITRGEAQMYIKNSTLIRAHPVVLMSTEMVVVPPKPTLEFEEDDASSSGSDEEAMERPRPTVLDSQMASMASPDQDVTIVVDRWLSFSAKAVEAAQLYCLRERLAAALAFKVKHPRKALPPMLAAAVYTIACLLSFDSTLNFELPPPASSAALTSRYGAQPGQQVRLQGDLGRIGKGNEHNNASVFRRSNSQGLSSQRRTGTPYASGTADGRLPRQNHINEIQVSSSVHGAHAPSFETGVRRTQQAGFGRTAHGKRPRGGGVG